MTFVHAMQSTRMPTYQHILRCQCSPAAVAVAVAAATPVHRVPCGIIHTAPYGIMTTVGLSWILSIRNVGSSMYYLQIRKLVAHLLLLRLKQLETVFLFVVQSLRVVRLWTETS